MARQEEIIIEVEVNAGESAERLAAVQARIHDVKQANKELKAEQRTINDLRPTDGDGLFCPFADFVQLSACENADDFIRHGCRFGNGNVAVYVIFNNFCGIGSRRKQ